MISIAEEYKGRYQITAYLIPARCLKKARCISKGKRISDYAADGITKDEKSYHLSGNSSKDHSQTCKVTVNTQKAPPDTEHSIRK